MPRLKDSFQITNIIIRPTCTVRTTTLTIAILYNKQDAYIYFVITSAAAPAVRYFHIDTTLSTCRSVMLRATISLQPPAFTVSGQVQRLQLIAAYSWTRQPEIPVLWHQTFGLFMHARAQARDYTRLHVHVVYLNLK